MTITEIAKKYHIILASASPRRKQLLSQMGLPFEVMPCSGEEKTSCTKVADIVEALSAQKAKEIEERVREGEFPPNYLIIAADTVVSADGRILGKPKDREDAVRMLTFLQGRKHQVYTGVTLQTARERRSFYECTDVEFAPLTKEQIAEYVDSGEPFDKAGSYGIQGSFAAYVTRIDGDFYNVVGLPLAHLFREIGEIDAAEYAAIECGRGADRLMSGSDPAAADAAEGAGCDEEELSAEYMRDHPEKPNPPGILYHGKHIRFMATDIDGTLVKDSSPRVGDDILRAIRLLTKKGVLCCVASGRQYYGIRRMFEEVKDDIVYIAENGAHIVYKGKDLSVTNMKPEQAREIIRQMRSYGKGYEFVISTPQGSLLESKDESFIAYIRDGYRNKMEVVEDVLEGDPVIIKCAMHHDGSVREVAEGELIPAWRDHVKVCMAGEEWIDFMDAAVDKGNALRFLQGYFGINYEETMTFGDNENDIGLMQAAAESYAVENACEQVKKAAKHICPDYTKNGVCGVLKEVLKGDGAMQEYDDAVLDALIKKQAQLFDENVAETREEARQFLEDCMAVVVDSKQEILDYFEEAGIDTEGADENEILGADEVFEIGDGRYLIVEG